MDARTLTEQYTEDIIKYNFANDMGLTIANFPNQYENKALVAMALADAELANARRMVRESLDLIQEAERLAPSLLTLTKDDKIAGPNVVTHVNLLKQLFADAKKAETEIQNLINEKIPAFRKALHEIGNAPKNTNMTPVTLERQKSSLTAIHTQFAAVEKLSKKIQESWTIIKEYNEEFAIAPAQARMRRGESAPPKPGAQV